MTLLSKADPGGWGEASVGLGELIGAVAVLGIILCVIAALVWNALYFLIHWKDGDVNPSGVRYLKTAADLITPGHVVVHNNVWPRKLGNTRGFQAWAQAPTNLIEPCPCRWASDFEPHFRKCQPASPPLDPKDWPGLSYGPL